MLIVVRLVIVPTLAELLLPSACSADSAALPYWLVGALRVHTRNYLSHDRIYLTSSRLYLGEFL